MDKIAQNIAKIKKTIESLEKRPIKVQLIAITKNFSQDPIISAINLGINNFGENRIQECETKFLTIKKKYPKIILHMVGPLQTNKVKKALTLFDVIHTLDREKLANYISAHITPQSKTKDFFIQVNIGDEKQKSGIEISKATDFIKWSINDLKINVIGLMCIPPLEESPRKYFSKLKKIAEENNLRNLSMGMTSDYEEAIKCGSTHIRIGTGIFGTR